MKVRMCPKKCGFSTLHPPALATHIHRQTPLPISLFTLQPTNISSKARLPLAIAAGAWCFYYSCTRTSCCRWRRSRVIWSRR